MLFRGQYSINLDAKGRMAMPTRFKSVAENHCEGEMVVTLEPNGEFLAIYPIAEYKTMEMKVVALSDFHPATLKLKDTFIGHATEVNLDGSGRLLVPLSLREKVGLDKRVALVGRGNKLHLWNEDSWNENLDKLVNQRFDINDLPDDMKDLSL